MNTSDGLDRTAISSGQLLATNPLSNFKFSSIGQPPSLLLRLQDPSGTPFFSHSTLPSAEGTEDSGRLSPLAKSSTETGYTQSGASPSDSPIRSILVSQSTTVPTFAATQVDTDLPAKAPNSDIAAHDTSSLVPHSLGMAAPYDHPSASPPAFSAIATSGPSRLAVSTADGHAGSSNHPSHSPDLFSLLAQLSQEQGELADLRSIRQRYLEEQEELVHRREETQRAMQREAAQADKVTALVQSAFEKIGLFRDKQEDRLTMVKKAAEGLAMETTRALEERTKADQQRLADEHRKAEVEQELEELRARHASVAAADAQKQQEARAREEADKSARAQAEAAARTAEENRRKEEQAERKAAEKAEAQLRAHEAIMRKALEAAVKLKGQEAARKLQEERERRAQEAEDTEKRRQQEIQKAQVMERKRAAAADNAAKSRAQLQARLEKERTEAAAKHGRQNSPSPSVAERTTPPKGPSTSVPNPDPAKVPVGLPGDANLASPHAQTSSSPETPSHSGNIMAAPSADLASRIGNPVGLKPSSSGTDENTANKPGSANQTAFVDSTGAVTTPPTSAKATATKSTVSARPPGAPVASSSHAAHGTDSVKVEPETPRIPRAPRGSGSRAAVQVSRKPPKREHSLDYEDPLNAARPQAAPSNLPQQPSLPRTDASTPPKTIQSGRNRYASAPTTTTDGQKATVNKPLPPGPGRRDQGVGAPAVLLLSTEVPYVVSEEENAATVPGPSARGQRRKAPPLAPLHIDPPHENGTNFGYADPWINTPVVERMSPTEGPGRDPPERQIAGPRGDQLWPPPPQNESRGDYYSPQSNRSPPSPARSPVFTRPDASTRAPPPLGKRYRDDERYSPPEDRPPQYRRRFDPVRDPQPSFPEDYRGLPAPPAQRGRRQASPRGPPRGFPPRPEEPSDYLLREDLHHHPQDMMYPPYAPENLGSGYAAPFMQDRMPTYPAMPFYEPPLNNLRGAINRPINGEPALFAPVEQQPLAARLSLAEESLLNRMSDGRQPVREAPDPRAADRHRDSPPRHNNQRPQRGGANRGRGQGQGSRGGAGGRPQRPLQARLSSSNGGKPQGGGGLEARLS